MLQRLASHIVAYICAHVNHAMIRDMCVASYLVMLQHSGRMHVTQARELASNDQDALDVAEWRVLPKQPHFGVIPDCVVLTELGEFGFECCRRLRLSIGVGHSAVSNKNMQ